MYAHNILAALERAVRENRQQKSQFRVLLLVLCRPLLLLHPLHAVLGEGRGLLVVVRPLGDDSARGVQLGLLGERVVAEVDVLGGVLALLSAPRLAPRVNTLINRFFFDFSVHSILCYINFF